MKILFLDIETAPNTVHVWGLYNQFVGINQIQESGYTLCWAAKWSDSKEIMFMSSYWDGEREMVEAIHALLNQADAVVHWNGKKFDIPTLNKEFLMNDLPPPAPFKQIDLLQTSRSRFKFLSNKLDYVAQALGLGKKIKHKGHELWTECMAGESKAWKKMREYNIQDVLLLEKIYPIFLPWIKNHPNHSMYQEDTLVCPSCGSKHFQKRGFASTISCTYQRYQCNKCTTWFRDTKSLGPKPGEKYVGV